MRITLVANEESGGGTDAGALADALRAHDAEVTRLDAGEASRAADGRPAPQRIAVAGGDGTIAPVARAAADADVALAVIPSGTANDFARAMGLPDALGDATTLAARADAHTRRVDLGDADGRPFVNAASSGLSVVAARHAKPLKPRLGALGYLAGAVRAGLTAQPRRVRVVADGRLLHDGPAWQVIVGVTGAFGGGSELAPADARDGLLDVAVIAVGARRRLARVALARRALGLRFGDVTRQPHVQHARAREIDVDAGPDARWNVDGEVCELPRGRFRAGGRFELVVP